MEAASERKKQMQVEHWSSGSKGRSRTVVHAGMCWTVANATEMSPDFKEQAEQSLRMLESHLNEAGFARTHLLSVQVILADISTRGEFDSLWTEWIGPNPAHWPQRACFESQLAPGLLIELVCVAAPSSAVQTAYPPGIGRATT